LKSEIGGNSAHPAQQIRDMWFTGSRIPGRVERMIRSQAQDNGKSCKKQ
jgi:hypothetical protein